MRLVIPEPFDRIPRHELLDVDRARAFKRDGGDLVLLQHHIFALARFIALHLFVIVHHLVGHAAAIKSHADIAGGAIDGLYTDIDRFARVWYIPHPPGCEGTTSIPITTTIHHPER